jgi:hypothetical protein
MPKGLTLAVPLGFLRGRVMVFMPSVQNLGEFLVAGSGWFVLVSARPTRKLSMSTAEIEAEFRDIIAGLRQVPDGGQVSCELWLYSRYGTFRHFRVRKDGLVEINAYGIPLDQVKMPAAGVPPGRDDAGAPAGQAAATGTSNVGANPMNPVLRWLKKWNTARLAGAKPGTVENGSLKKVLDAGGPATKKRRSSGKKPAGSKTAAGGPADPEKNSGTGKPGAGKTKVACRKKTGEQGRDTVPDNDPVTTIPPNPGSVAAPISPPVEAGPVSPVTGETEKGSPEGGDLG